MVNPSRDNIYDQYRQKVSDFIFDEKVAAVFDDMIRRSIPGYATVIGMTKVFAEHYVQPGSNCYDLGCASGASTLAMRKGIDKDGCKIIAVDNSQAMLSRCSEIIDADDSDVDVEVVCADVNDIAIENASMVVMNYTLQFLSPENRDAMIQRISNGMLSGGVLLLSEKIEFESSTEQDFQIDMFHEFKKLMGYSDREINQKRKALENVLIPDSLLTHKRRLYKAGFVKVHVWFQCFNFVSIAAFKKP
jgi:tRNA (cmo5U34)-methyltransferase